MEDALEKLRQQFWIVQVDVDSYIDDENGTDREFTRKIRRGMYDVSSGGEPNEITESVKAALEAIEGGCLPVLRLEAR